MTTYVGFSNATFTAATSLTSQVPSGVLEGDLLVAIVCKNAAGSHSAPAGWTICSHDSNVKLGSSATALAYNGSAPTGGAGFYWRIATAADEATPTYTWTVASCNGSTTMLAFRDLNPQLLGNAIVSSFLIDHIKAVTRSASTIESGPLGNHNCTGDLALIVTGMLQLVTATTTVLATPVGYNEVANNSQSGVSSSIGYQLVDLAADPSFASKSIGTNTASGNGAGYVVVFSDRTAEQQTVDVNPYAVITAPGILYRMRGFDATAGSYVFWTSEEIDSDGSDYTGPGPLSDIVIQAVMPPS